MTSDSTVAVLAPAVMPEAAFMCPLRSEKLPPSHVLEQKIKWVVKSSQFLRKTLQKTVEKEGARKKTGHGGACTLMLPRAA